ncbi:MAG: hypothetical protein GY925_30425 [Actinomycetia bacterium]|nr:hypothetical protein [Actinomycetes bacterium]
MTAGYGLGLGRVFNVVPSASGALINMRDYGAVSFVTFEDDGSTILTLTESTSAAGAGEQALAAITKIHKGPGIGGTWTEVTQSAASTYDLADDTTNDAVVYTVEAAELSDGYDFIECTVDGGVVMAICHDLMVSRAGDKLATTIA